MQNVMEDFKQWCGLFNMQGDTFGIHVLISVPSIPYPKNYYYHKSKGYSMVAQTMVDSNKKCIDIFIGLPRNVNDSQVLNFGLYQQAQYHFFLSKQRMSKWNFALLVWGQKVFVYQLNHDTIQKKWLPHLLWNFSTKENKSKAMVVVENVFGILKKTF
jgi:hypothetical protein